MSKWQHLLLGMGGILGIMIIVWLAWGGISYSAITHTASSEYNHIENENDKSRQQATEGYTYFIDRARATEAGFKAAFPFHK